jgi:branched-chain amino acid transport system substrate-binding protein
MFRKFLLLVSAALLVVLSGISSAQGDSIRVGAIFDLSGLTSDVGTPYAEGVQAYVEWINSNGGVAGSAIDLLWEDYAYDVPTAERLYTQFVQQGIVAFMGWGTDDTEALQGRIAQDEIPFMSASYSASLNDPNGEAPYNFLVGTTYSDQLVILMGYMLDEWTAAGNEANTMRLVVFHHDSSFGTSPLADGQTFADDNGVSMLAIPMPSRATDLTAELTQAESFGATHAIIQNNSTPAALLLINAEDIGLLDTIQFGCLNWCADEILIDEAESAAEGVLGALPFSPTTVDLPGQEEPRAWLEANGESLQESTLHFTQGWWTMAIMAEGIRLTLEAGEDLTGANLRRNLETIAEFDTGGITAPITFTPEDHRGNRSLTVFRVEDGIWTPASAPIVLTD